MANAPIGATGPTLQTNLNRCMPAAREASLGDCLYDLINHQNALIALLAANPPANTTAAQLNALVTKLPEQR